MNFSIWKLDKAKIYQIKNTDIMAGVISAIFLFAAFLSQF